MNDVMCQGCRDSFHIDTMWLTEYGLLCDKCNAYTTWGVRANAGHNEPNAEKPAHTHTWKSYIGLTDNYEYCDCGEKKTGSKQ